MGPIVELAVAGRAGRELVGGKAATLGKLAAAGFPVPDGFVVQVGSAADVDRHAASILAAAQRLGPGPLAVRSSAVAEDLAGASYAGLYESVLDVPPAGVLTAVRRVVEAAGDPRVAAYRVPDPGGPAGSSGIAVLVQPMVDAEAAGVAFTADPVSGDRRTTVITAVPGTAERLVGGELVGEEWRIRDGRAEPPSSSHAGGVLKESEALAVADLACRVAAHAGSPQDVEWAVDRDGRVRLLQARPMTALPAAIVWKPPSPGLWMRNFRLGEWLGEAMTPLFATWLLPLIEAGFEEGMRATLGAVLPYRWAVINGWYYNAPCHRWPAW